MNTRLSEGNVFCIPGRILGLAGLASLALVCAGAAWPQSQTAQPESIAASSAAAATSALPASQSPSAASAPKPALAPHAPAKLSAARGQHEGIQVHGHWTIVVRNPDGKVVSRTEFEMHFRRGFLFHLLIML